MMKHLILSCCLSLATMGVVMGSFPLEGAISAEPNWNQCVKVYDGGMQANSQRVIRFYNGCPQRVYINACVRSTDGEVKLYKSGQSIMTNGNFKIYTFPFVTPATIRWSAGHYTVAEPKC